MTSMLGFKCPNCSTFLDWNHLFANGLYCKCSVKLQQLCTAIDRHIPETFDMKIVYFFKKKKQIMYVGSTKCLSQRLCGHRRDGALKGVQGNTYEAMKAEDWRIHISLILGERLFYIIMKPPLNCVTPSGQGTDTITLWDEQKGQWNVRNCTYGTTDYIECDNIASYNECKKTHRYYLDAYCVTQEPLVYYDPVCGLMDRPKKELYKFCYGIKQQGQKHSDCKCKRYCPAEYNLYKCLGKLEEWHEMKAKEILISERKQNVQKDKVTTDDTHEQQDSDDLDIALDNLEAVENKHEPHTKLQVQYDNLLVEHNELLKKYAFVKGLLERADKELSRVWLLVDKLSSK